MASSTIQKWGNARAVRIPKALAVEAGLEEGTAVELRAVAGGILVKPKKVRKQYVLSELLAACKGKNPHQEQVTGKSGRELF